MLGEEADGVEGSHDVDIIIGRELLNDDAWLQRGEGVSKICKKEIPWYVDAPICKSQQQTDLKSIW